MAITYLYIDDDREDQEIFSLAVGQLGKGIVVINLDTGQALLDLLSTEMTLIPDYIFLDLEMPNMAGFEILKSLREIPRLHQTKIIIYSDFVSGKEADDLKRMGAKDAIKKFYSLEHLKFFLSKLNTDQPVYK